MCGAAFGMAGGEVKRQAGGAEGELYTDLMRIELSAETHETLKLKNYRLGATTTGGGILLGKVLNALREAVPDDERDGIRYTTADSGEWWVEEPVVELNGKAEETLVKCAEALGVSAVEALAMGVDRLVAPSQVTWG